MKLYLKGNYETNIYQACKEYHKDVLSLTYDEAVEISLEELKTMVPVRDPLWEEEERLREEYIKIHGERVYDDEEED